MERNEFLKFYTDTPKYTHEPGLEVMQALLRRLGDPQNALQCLHIAGTNGKGSCAAMAASVLQAAGYKTGLFTSPDLTDMRQRISIDGVSITTEDFAAVTAVVCQACRGLDAPSFFEKITAAAFYYFQKQGCDLVVLETGLGGRLDATNVINSPVLSVIMPIGLDHTAQLGNTLTAIAREKAGIIKPGRPVIAACQAPEAMAVLEKTALSKNAPLYKVDINKITYLGHSPSGQRFSYDEMENISLSLLGAHQVQNACAVIEAARVMGLSEPVIRAGLGQAQWPCRFEYFPGCTPPLLLDGAHNGHGAAALGAGLAEYFPGQKFTFLLGVMADKDYEDILARLEPLARRVICLAPDSPRALPAKALAAQVKTVPALAAEDLAQALALARGYDDPICACGSLYYVGLLRQMIQL
jgi:dihydrofolate synthase/folylpolyglutamate synthase